MTAGPRASDDDDGGPAGTQRLDKWLWFTRIVKSRTLAATLVSGGKVRVNRLRVDKPSQQVKPGDVVTIAVHERVHVLKMLAGGVRRGPASEAVHLYEDLTPPVPPRNTELPTHGARETGSGRPTKRDRRAIDRLTRE